MTRHTKMESFICELQYINVSKPNYWKITVKTLFICTFTSLEWNSSSRNLQQIRSVKMKFILLLVCGQSLSWVQLFATTWTVALPVSVYGIFQARILEWVAISSSKGSSPPRDLTHVSCVSCIGRQICSTASPGRHL